MIEKPTQLFFYSSKTILPLLLRLGDNGKFVESAILSEKMNHPDYPSFYAVASPD